MYTLVDKKINKESFSFSLIIWHDLSLSLKELTILINYQYPNDFVEDELEIKLDLVLRIVNGNIKFE